MHYIKINHIKYVDDIMLLDNNEEELNKLYVVFFAFLTYFQIRQKSKKDKFLHFHKFKI
jgi:hypothetical protein